MRTKLMHTLAMEHTKVQEKHVGCKDFQPIGIQPMPDVHTYYANCFPPFYFSQN